MSRALVLVAATIASVGAAAIGRAVVAGDGPMPVPVTAASFGNLAGYEGGNGGGERGGANWLDRSGPEFGHFVGGGVTPDTGIPVYTPPMRRPYVISSQEAAMYLISCPESALYRSTTGMSSYDARPRITDIYGAFGAVPVERPSSVPAYSSPAPAYRPVYSQTCFR